MIKISNELTMDNRIYDANPFDMDTEDLDWLELDNIPKKIYNPLIDYPIGESRPDPVEEFIGFMMDPNYLHFTARMILGVELPPYQVAILDTLWNKRLPMLIGTRGAAKSFILGVYCLLRMILHPGCKIVIVGAGLRQSRQVYDYMDRIWQKSAVLRDLAGRVKTAGPRREVDRFQFEIGESHCWAIPIGDGTKIRGLRANYIIADEFASIPEEIFNLVVQGFAIVSSDPVEKMKKAARIKRLKRLGQWNDAMESLNSEQTEGNQIVYSGTPFYAFNHFAKTFKKWHRIISSKGDRKKLEDMFGDNEKAFKGFNWKDYAIIRLPYNHVPDGLLDEGILAQAKATLTINQFFMEYCGIFPTDSDGFYKRSIIESATTNRPIMTSGGKLVQFSAIREGTKDRFYVIGVDPAADKDNAAIVILEIHDNHRRVIHCWTTNRSRHNKLKAEMASKGIIIEDDYYRYIARKIRGLMKTFLIERIIMDKNGGGTAIAEALKNKKECKEYDEIPVYEIIIPDEPKMDDMEKGCHILQMLAPTQDINIDANHGMLKDLQEKVLLFPLFDTIEIAKSTKLDEIEDLSFDTYEDLVNEIEDLKSEMESIVMTGSSILGKETFDTPAIKQSGGKKGYLRKDRYSALLYANYYARTKENIREFKLEYKATGGTKDNRNKNNSNAKNMYYGPGLVGFQGNQGWLSGNSIRYVKHGSN